MQIWVCGVRGSTPSPGAEFDRYGGHTSCVVLGHDCERPSLILDAGTGIRGASDLFAGGAFEGSILLGHLHWDHTQGLPFFGAGDRPGSRVDLYVPAQGDTEVVLGRFMSPPHFPITPGDLRGSWRFRGLDSGEREIEGFTVLAREIPHKGGRTFGYRVSDGHSTIAYLSDHCPTQLGPGPAGVGEYHEAALALADGSDAMFHDAQYTDSEIADRAGFGHSSTGYAVGLAEAAGVGTLLLYHHDPSRTDDEIDKIVAGYADAGVEVSAVAQGAVLDLSARL